MRITTFGRLRIQTARGEISEGIMQKSAIAPVLVFLLLQKRRPIPSSLICENLWKDSESEPSNKLKNIVYRFRKDYKELFPGEGLIVTRDGGYCLNPEYKIISDMDEFDNCIHSSERFLDKGARIRFLKKALHIYNGKIFPPDCADAWIEAKSVHYESLFRKAVNKLVPLLEQKSEYEDMVEITNHALRVSGPNEQLYLWHILSLNRVMAYEQAQQQYQKAKGELADSEYNKLTRALQEENIIFDPA